MPCCAQETAGATRAQAPAKQAPTAQTAAPAKGAARVDERYSEYHPVQGVSGNIKSIGSDTLNNLMTLWGEGFKTQYPNVQIEIDGKGSSTAPPALIEGTSTFGPMSRKMKAKEEDDFEKKYGYKPTAIPTSVDMLAVYVHKDNPLASLTLQQVDAIFSKSRKGGFERDVRTWGDVGLTGEWADKPISLYGRNSASGTYGFFKEHALVNGDFKDAVKEQPGSSAVVQGVASDKYGIGYSGIGYRTADVRAVPLAVDASKAPVAAEIEHAYDGTYPMWRFLYVYVNHQPSSKLDPLRREFLSYVLSKQGQLDVLKDGYFPLPYPVAEKTLKSIGALVSVHEAGSAR
ncbi:MAG: phosphate ABC transporter substrate-binding protein [Planctomycetota bacterium]|nr:MAG: phosphate ABC transporter substrate-binding protein [Planctomycetota bacterium]